MRQPLPIMTMNRHRVDPVHDAPVQRVQLDVSNGRWRGGMSGHGQDLQAIRRSRSWAWAWCKKATKFSAFGLRALWRLRNPIDIWALARGRKSVR